MKINIRDYSFEVGEPYQAGHVCTSAEAQALNVHRTMNLRQNLIRTLDIPEDGTILSAEDLADLRRQVREADEVYDMGHRQVTMRRRTSRFDLMLRTVAQERVEEQARQAGRNLTLGEAEVAIVAMATNPAVHEEARARLREGDIEAKGLMEEIRQQTRARQAGQQAQAEAQAISISQVADGIRNSLDA